MKTNFRKPEYKIRQNVTLKNAFNNTSTTGDIINEEEIDGRAFYVIKCNGRVQKLAKEAHTIVNKGK